MSCKPESTQQSLSSLSSDRAKLLALLVEKKMQEAAQLRAHPRGAGSATMPTSWAQQRLWFIDQLEGGGAAYNLPVAMRMRGVLNVLALRKALDALVQRHESLRTVIVDVRGDAQQKIAAEGSFILQEFPLAGRDSTELEQEVRAHKAAEWHTSFDLRAGPLVRGRLLRVADDEHVLLITMHHIVSDGWSVGILLRELVELYNAYEEGRATRLAPLPIQYADYAQWQRDWLKGAVLEGQLSYWREQLSGAPAELQLPTDRPRPATQGYRGESVPLILDAGLTERLNAFARRHGMTLFMLLYAAWAILLARLTGQEDIVIGTPVANRRRAELEGLIGFFVNTLALRVNVSAQVSLAEFLASVRDATLAAFDHQDMPFEQLVEAVRPERSLNRHPIFQTLFVLQNTPQAELRLTGLTANLEEVVVESSKFDLLLSLEERRGEIAGCINFDSDLFDRTTIERWAACLATLLEGMLKTPEERIGDLPFLTAHEQQMLEQFNATQADHSCNAGIHELFERQVEQTPAAVALVHGACSLTYAELNGRANRLARYLRDEGIEPDQLVGVCIERSPEMIVALLAILKAGGAYLPLDPHYPRERLQYMLEDAAPPVVLTQESLRALLPASAAKVFSLDEELPSLAGSDDTNLAARESGSTPANLVYVIYTSGSTGRPKGTAMPHGSMVNLMEWHRTALPSVDSRSVGSTRVLQYAALSFDVAFQEIFTTLCAGATLVLLDEWVRKDAAALTKLLNEQRVTRLFIPPMMLQALAEYFKISNIAPETLTDVIAAGEQLRVTAETMGFFRRLRGCRLHNHYGPTETHVVTALTLDGDPEQWPLFPTIGRPIANTQIHVLDAKRRCVPVGVVGEIYIAGANVARGYLHRPELTMERFVADPFSGHAHAHMYKTGDLGRWRADGMIEYLGRNDDQVKLRGFRIELGEIETHLARHEGVKEAAIVVREDEPGNKRLIAYFTERHHGTLAPEQLRAHLKTLLPDHMVPSAFVALDAMPMTPSGKLNRRALPAPSMAAFVSEHYEAPQGAVEQELARIWQELLQVQRVGRDDSFFQLGGHSLLVLRALFKIHESFDVNVRVADVYRSPTLRELARIIDGESREDHFVDLSKEATLDEQLVALSGSCRSPARAVLLTGATGFVGRFLLAQLLQESDARIYCLLRAESVAAASARLRAVLLRWDLWCDDVDRRVVAIPGDLRSPSLGMDERTYQMLAHDVDAIYHCGTSMNHLETYSMAKPANVVAARELLRLATQYKPKLINYISTLGVFAPAATAGVRVVDELTSICDEKHLSSRGYVASKWVGEKIFLSAAERGIPCNIFRLGLVWADSQLGRYDELQRAYRIIKSCLLSGYAIRGYRHEMAPVPVDYTARAIVYLAGQHPAGGGIFHIASTEQMSDGVFECCNSILPAPLQLQPYYDWIRTIKRLHDEGCSLPAVPLMEFAFSMEEESFYQYLLSTQVTSPRFDCSRTQRELARAGIVAPILNEKWLRLCIENMLYRDAELHALPGVRAIGEGSEDGHGCAPDWMQSDAPLMESESVRRQRDIRSQLRHE